MTEIGESISFKVDSPDEVNYTFLAYSVLDPDGGELAEPIAVGEAEGFFSGYRYHGNSILVRDEFQGRGIASGLVDKIRTEIDKNGTQLFTGVLDNPGSVIFHSKYFDPHRTFYRGKYIDGSEELVVRSGSELKGDEARADLFHITPHFDGRDWHVLRRLLSEGIDKNFLEELVSEEHIER